MFKMSPITNYYFVFIFKSIVLIAQANDGTSPLMKTFQTANRNMNFDRLDYKNVDDQDMVFDKFVRKTSFNFKEENNLRNSTDAPNDENVETSNAEFIKKLMNEKELALGKTENIANDTTSEIPDDMKDEIIKQFLLTEIQKPLVTSDNIKHEEKQKVLKDLLSNVLGSASDNREPEIEPIIKLDEENTTIKITNDNESPSNFSSDLVANDTNVTAENNKLDQTENERLDKNEKLNSEEENSTVNRKENEETSNISETQSSPSITKRAEGSRNLDQLLSSQESQVGLPDSLIQNIDKSSQKFSQLENPILGNDIKLEKNYDSPQAEDSTNKNTTLNEIIDIKSQKNMQREDSRLESDLENKKSNDSNLTEDDRLDQNIKNDPTIDSTTMNTRLVENIINIAPQNHNQIDASSLEDILKIEKSNVPAQTEDDQSGENIKNDFNMDSTKNNNTLDAHNVSSLDNDQKQKNSNDSVEKELNQSEDNRKNDFTMDFTTTSIPLDDNIDITASSPENGLKKKKSNDPEDNQFDEIRKKDNSNKDSTLINTLLLNTEENKNKSSIESTIEKGTSGEVTREPRDVNIKLTTDESDGKTNALLNNDGLESQVSATESGDADGNNTNVNEKDEKTEISPQLSSMESVNSETLMAPKLMAIPTLNLNNKDPSMDENMIDEVKANAPKSLSGMTVEQMKAMSDQDILQALEENNTINPEILEQVNNNPDVMRELLSGKDIPSNDSATSSTEQLPASRETDTQPNIPLADLLAHNPFESELPLEASPMDTRVLKSMSDAQLQAALISLLASMNPTQTNQITLQPTGYGSFLTFIGDVDLNIELVPVQSNPLTRKKAKAMFKEVSKALSKFQSKLPPGTDEVVKAVIGATVPGGSEAIQVAELVSDIVKKQKEAKKNKRNSEWD